MNTRTRDRNERTADDKRRVQLTVKREVAIRMDLMASIRGISPAELVEGLILDNAPPLPTEYMAVAG